MFSLVSTAVLGGGILFSQTTEATAWTANLPNTIQLTERQKDYTMKLGDTLWAISQRTNLTVQALADINGINLSKGEQYSLPIGRVISFDGNKVIVQDSLGTIVNEATITEEQKVNSNQEVGIAVNPSVTTPNTNETDSIQPNIPGENGNDGEVITPELPVNPEKPINPTEPEKPIEPELPVEPEKTYRGEFIDGVNNGTIGTWTSKDEMIAYISEHWAENSVNGTWTDNYVASTNAYGWIAEFY